MLAKGVEMKSIHEIDSAAQPIATDTHASDQSRSQVRSGARRNAGTDVRSSDARYQHVNARLGNDVLGMDPGRRKKKCDQQNAMPRAIHRRRSARASAP